MTNEEIKKFYNENPDFHAYIDRMCRTGRYTVDQALTLKIVENVAQYYAERAKS